MWRFTSVGTFALFQLIVFSVLARLVTPAEFGTLAIANLVNGLVGMFVQIGLGPALIQRRKITPDHLNTAFSISILLSLVGTTLMWQLAPTVSAFFRTPEAKDVLRVVSLSFLFASLGVVPEAALQRELRFKSIMIAYLGGYIFGYGAIAIPMAFAGFGVWSLISGILGYSLLRSILLMVISPRRPNMSLKLRAGQELMSYGGGQTIMRFFNYAALQADYFIIGRNSRHDGLGIVRTRIQSHDHAWAIPRQCT